MGTPIYDKMMADAAKKKKNNKSSARVKATDVSSESKSSGVASMAKGTKPNKTAAQKIQRGKK